MEFLGVFKCSVFYSWGLGSIGTNFSGNQKIPDIRRELNRDVDGANDFGPKESQPGAVSVAGAHFANTALFSWFYTTFKLARIIGGARG